MERLRAVLGFFVVVVFLGMVCFGCSGDSSAIPSNLSTRVNVLFADNGTLAPVVESAGEGTVSATDQSWEYTLTLENVSEDVLWYTDRPGRESGTETVQNYIDLWPKMYGEVSPNAVLDGYLNGETLNDGLYLRSEQVLYDSKTNRLTFQVTLLGSTMTDQHPVDPVDIYDIKLTVLDNTPEGEVNYWSFGQTAQGGVLEPTGTDGSYTLILNGVYQELYQVQNAPGTRFEILNTEFLEYNWSHYFSTAAPNSSLSGYTNLGELQLVLLELDNPSHQGDNVSYDATVLGGQVLPDDLLSDVTLLIDSPDGTVPLCSQSGAEAKCYNQCFPSGLHPTPLCCPKGNPVDYNCSETGKADWCDYTLCKGSAPGKCSSEICTTYRKPSGELTKLVIHNNTDSDVKVYLQVGANNVTKGACPESWSPLQLEDYPCEHIHTGGGVCDWTIKAHGQTTIEGKEGRCTNGTISFAMDPAETCGMSLGEFTLNVDPDPAKDLDEGVDISLVNGNNGKIEVALGSSWKVQTTGTFVTRIENYEGTGANNQNKNGVYNYLCDKCTSKWKPPDCPGTETCSTQETCNLLRDGAQQGGTVTFTWKGPNW
ncbi:MAG: hypothetical protein BA865_13170 [Desulfobacterales bacterium S5133MH4]|jgi:hypothetical protein|nr:MAG: hypothetical protein BA865_13170 [Desulfobacterales bacterium S5133MH4]